MSILKARDLLSQLSKLNRTVSEFSFEELTADEAKDLQRSFNQFRIGLENHIYGENTAPESDSLNKLNIKIGKIEFEAQHSKDCASIGADDFFLKTYTLDEFMTMELNNVEEGRKSIEFSQILKKDMIQTKENTKIELTHLMKDCFGELEVCNELVKLFKMNVLEFVGNVKLHLINNDLTGIAFSAHKLKAGLTMLKANGMRELIVELEKQCKANRLNEVKKLYDIFLEDYPLLEQNLDKELALLNKK